MQIKIRAIWKFARNTKYSGNREIFLVKQEQFEIARDTKYSGNWDIVIISWQIFGIYWPATIPKYGGE